MKDFTVADPAFRATAKVTETTDTNHADNINAAPMAAFENTLALSRMMGGAYGGRDLSKLFEEEIDAYAEGDGASEVSEAKDKAAGGEEEAKAWLWMRHRISKGDYAGIHVGDWLPITIKCENQECASCAFHGECQGALHGTPERHEMQVAGIDTYTGTAGQEWHHRHSVAETVPVPHHVDFISRDLLSPEVKWNAGNTNSGEYCGKWVCDNECPNYESRSSCTFHKDKSGISSLTSNCSGCSKNSACKFYTQKDSGTDFCTDAGNDCPYNTSRVRAFLDFLYEHSLKAAYDGVITSKSMLGERRAYQPSGGQLTDSTGRHWYGGGKLWLPTEYEVYGSVIYGTPSHSAGQAAQYPLFAGGWGARLKKAGPDGSNRGYWWLACAMGGSSTDACYVHGDGAAGANVVTHSNIRVPVCFRIAAPKGDA